jgi:uncharacterized protein YabE (DUF348 family)/3D (Asp-Asp-Asp) domain-containing protein
MQKLKKKPLSKKQLIILISSICVIVAAVVGVVAYQLSIPTYFYTITDQNRIKHIKSLSDNVEEVLQEAGVYLSEHDRYEVSQMEKGTAVTVQRAQLIAVTVKGESRELYTMGTTVGELLKQNSIGTEAPWQVSVPLTDETYNGMSVKVDLVETESHSVERPLPYKTLYCQDPSLPEGETELLFAGIEGIQQTVTERTYINGALKGISVQENIELEAATPEVVAVGTGERVGEERKFPLFGDQVIITKDGKQLYYSHMEIFEATGYTSWIDDVTGTTACGTPARVGAVAVDPKVIPYFTKMYIVSEDGVYDYGEASAEDCGGAIKGKIIDLFFDTESECWQFGRRDIQVYFLTEKP